PPGEQIDPSVGMRYYYVGLKKRVMNNGQESWQLKTKTELCQEYVRSLQASFSLTAKRGRWMDAVKRLESDHNFAEMDLCRLGDVHSEDPSEGKNTFKRKAAQLFERMSAGHASVLLTVTRLVEAVEEKTLVLIDEPESHLHPPLLSAFTRALSDLLVNRNGVAIVATHSPVVLQEVPKSCVSIIRRSRLTSEVDEPEIETFAENVGVLTREVFGLEVSKSGFHDLLAQSVEEGKGFEEIEEEYRNRLGFEGKALLRAILSEKGTE
ncbi:AAA family ATPase, partial [Arhodomonas aquaeolei]|uniref:AAA family ATPase n=1 Tax=Arhodomonas aquaeolei TaxID=2369 RepID=UPI0012EC020C